MGLHVDIVLCDLRGMQMADLAAYAHASSTALETRRLLARMARNGRS